MSIRTRLCAAAVPLLAFPLVLPGAAPAAAVSAPPPAPLAVPAGTYGELTPEGAFAAPPAAGLWWSSTGRPTSFGPGALTTSVGTDKPRVWDAMVGRNQIRLRAGALYTLSFDASASRASDIRVTVQENSGAFTAPLDRTVTLGPGSVRHQWTFRSSVSTPTGQITFQVGGQSADTGFTFDNVSLTTSTPREGFYTDPDSTARRWVDGDTTGHPRKAEIRSKIADNTTVKWFGNWSGATDAQVQAAVDSYVTAAAGAGRIPTLVAYNVPGRDCGGASADPSVPGTAQAYKNWIAAFSRGIGGRPAIVVLEPDAVAQADRDYRKHDGTPCLTEIQRTARFDMLSYATWQLDAQGPLVRTYLDAGNARWILGEQLDDTGPMGLAEMVEMLGRSGLALADGVAVNVANFQSNAVSDDYGSRLAARALQTLGITTTWVVDTGRNGTVQPTAPGDFCNPRGRTLGLTSRQGDGTAAAYYLWIKNPGDSDGRREEDPRCEAGVPKAGHFSPELALRLIDGS
ncbi:MULTISPECIES: glycoside hydrolase family 6 protein [Streptomyces]|uniref:glycoside hydrolase family 6 protein n=1 Tax=Streptomyces TaxID=1883 RepID=UPI00102E8C09|nr:glycoside hydrolase family 6 protein [Streptomyces tsukubensis]MYS63338.1 endoglucanase [Streptomyces sp. SID5473]TAI42220.1 endoglucanase [Streptomyces tsukubensis]